MVIVHDKKHLSVKVKEHISSSADDNHLLLLLQECILVVLNIFAHWYMLGKIASFLGFHHVHFGHQLKKKAIAKHCVPKTTDL